MGIWEVIQKEIVDKPEISAELRTSWREQAKILKMISDKLREKDVPVPEVKLIELW